MLGAGTAFGERVTAIGKLLGIGSKQTLAGECGLVSLTFGSKPVFFHLKRVLTRKGNAGLAATERGIVIEDKRRCSHLQG